MGLIFSSISPSMTQQRRQFLCKIIKPKHHPKNDSLDEIKPKIPNKILKPGFSQTRFAGLLNHLAQTRRL